MLPNTSTEFKFESNLQLLLRYIEHNQYRGFDLYDGLKITDSPILLKNRYINSFLTQSFKLSPVNVRKLVGIKPTKMPKAMGLFLNCYALLAEITVDKDQSESYLNKAKPILAWLEANCAQGYGGPCWNFGFNYRQMFDTPTVVITSIIAKGLFNYYNVTKCEQAKRILLKIADFILSDLPTTTTDDGLCFSYTPIQRECCFNASMLATETLAKIYFLTNEQKLLDYICRSVDFTIAYQKDDGRWNYRVDTATGNERAQVDFHQGYVVESLYDTIKYAGLNDPKYEKALHRGTEFYYKEQFFPDGRAKRRLPRIWPVDIHNQSQGIITFSKLCELDSQYLGFSKTIAQWTIDHMQNRSGYFYFQVYPHFTNKIAYMRWSQAWMALALIELKKAWKNSFSK